jgi:hypothetical protein
MKGRGMKKKAILESTFLYLDYLVQEHSITWMNSHYEVEKEFLLAFFRACKIDGKPQVAKWMAWASAATDGNNSKNGRMVEMMVCRQLWEKHGKIA